MISPVTPEGSRAMRGHALPQLFEAQVSRTPGKVALVHDGQQLTYAELDGRANQIAHFLARRGAGPGQLVAVMLGRSADLVAALLAVLKSGAGYVPLSVDDPKDRLDYILADAGASLVITSVDDQVRGCPPTPPGPAGWPPARAEDIAYVIYTSGSTGRPKGVAIEHAALASYLSHCRAEYPSLAGRALLHSSVSFDMAVTSLYGPLISGGTVVLADLTELARAGSPPRWLQQPTFLKVTPSHLPLLQALPAACSPSEQLVIGGEALTAAALGDWRQAHPAVTVINEYGPTEATVGCCTYVVRPGQVLRPGPVPIGRPTRGTQLYVLDESLRPVPDGQPGELCIAGGQLARGYLHQPALTTEKFPPGPVGPGRTRMYRTGDLVRAGSSGELEFLGRIDDQVKVSGYRVEPGEVEAAITGCEGVAHCAVTVRDIATGATAGEEKQLVAYLVAAAGTPLDIVTLRRHAAAVLPPYMVPAAFVPLTELPLTASGKLDRSRLPAVAPCASRDITPALTPQQAQLCELFREVTGAERVGIDDDFLALGGSSIGAARLVTRARKAGMEIALLEVLRKRTVRQILAPHEGTGNESRTRGTARAR